MLFHRDLGIPEDAVVRFGQILLDYSPHALNAATTDRYGNIQLPKILDTSHADVIEVEIVDNSITKVLYRIPYDERYDLMLAIVPKKQKVKTVWLNSNRDSHTTLDESRYALP